MDLLLQCIKKYQALFFVSIVVVIGIVGIIVLKIEISQFKIIEKNRNENLLARIQELDAGITFQNKRLKLLLETKSKIMEVALKGKVEMTQERAYQMAEANILASDKYGIDPNFLLAIQTTENRFSITRRSSMGAIGHNQIWEPTGRVLCRCLGWEYSIEVLENIYKSTELAALLIQIHVASYSKYENYLELVAAAYNGGPKNAEYYRTKNKLLSKETADYVPLVIGTYKEYIQTIGVYAVQTTLDSLSRS